MHRASALVVIALGCTTSPGEVRRPGTRPLEHQVSTTLALESFALPEPSPITHRLPVVHLVRADPRHFALELRTPADGDRRTAREWADEAGFEAVINASMYEPDGRSSSWLVQEGHVRAPDDPRFGGLLAFDGLRVGTQCDVPRGQVLALFRNAVANYRVLGCSGEPIAWQDADAYSMALHGMDDAGRVVFVHVREPMRVGDLARLLAGRGLRALSYAEGGQDATLFVRDGRTAHELVGASRAPDDADRPVPAQRLPNVLGLRRRLDS